MNPAGHQVTWLASLAAPLVVLSLGLSNASADSCIWSAKEVGKSKDERFVVTATFDEEDKHWVAVWRDTTSGMTSSAVLKGVKRHAHVTILVPPDGKTFVVLDPSAGHRETDRIQVYFHDGKLIKSYGLKDVLNKDEMSRVGYSISHTWWMGYDKPNKRRHWLNADGSALEFLTMAGRAVQITLKNRMPQRAQTK